MANILVIDDDAGACQLVKLALERAGHAVVSCTKSADATKLYTNETKFDLVITDIFMPDQDGLGVIMDIKKIDPDARIIAISGGGNTVKSDFLQLAKRLGAVSVLKKPCSPDELRAAVDQALTPS